MALVDILHMNSGSGDASFANNSLLVKIVMLKTAPFLKRTIKGMANKDILSDHCFMIADLGCSSGMNTLSLASNIIDIVHEMCQENNRKTPQFQVCLNDLFGNNFNNVFKLLPNFYKTLRKCKENKLVLVLFQLFPDPSMEDSSPMKGLVQGSDINSFNLPVYFPHGDELKRIIEEDGSFSLDDMDIFEVDWDQHDIECNNRGKKTTKSKRAITEPLFTSHFGNSITDMLFKKFEKKLAEHLATKKTKHLCVVISLKKK
ncbi:putative 7-methylxanthosine synthase [Helianthus debilis subsp. tardiflorus]